MQVTWAEMHGNSSMIQLTQFNCYLRMYYAQFRAFQVAILLKNLPASAGDTGLIHRSGRSLGGENDDLLQYSCLGNPKSLAGYSPWGPKELDIHVMPNSLGKQCRTERKKHSF